MVPQRLSPKVLSWASIVDPKAQEQAIQSATLPIVQPHIALMPDAHVGIGATVGSVIPTVNAIIPAAIGVDIGCGMNAVQTSLTLHDIAGQDLKTLRHMIEDAIPLSAGVYNSHITDSAALKLEALREGARERGFMPESFDSKWEIQLGSLGGGNHFIEICSDETGQVWIFLHSGSRGIGNKVARHHIEQARVQAERQSMELPHPDLAYFTEGTEEFAQYIDHMMWCQDFAAHNRLEMQERVWQVLNQWWESELEILQEISCHHNYTAREEHFGRNLWISRKGAISAQKGELGLIPGSMGDKSYVVVGKGEESSMASAPHGAGRRFSRNAARKKFTQADLRMRMKGIEYRDSSAFIDEIPDAYKPIDQVMQDAASLVSIQHVLRQLVNVKGK